MKSSIEDDPSLRRRASSFASRLCALAAVCGTALLADSQSTVLVADGRPDFQIEYQGSEKPLPKWENGYVLTVDPDSASAPLLSVFGSSGTKIFTRSIALDGAGYVLLRDVAASPKGVFAVTGGAYYGSVGAAGNFIAYLNGNGDVTRIVRLQDFAGFRLCFTADGRLWVAGAASPNRSPDAPMDYDLIRVYDGDGVLQGSTVRRSLFVNNPMSGSYLSANRDSVVLFGSRTGDLVRVSHTGEVISASRLPVPPDALFTGMAVSNTAEVVVSCQLASGEEQIKFLLLNQNANDWIEVYSRSQIAQDAYAKVYGFEGSSLLAGRFHPVRFSWLRLQR